MNLDWEFYEKGFKDEFISISKGDVCPKPDQFVRDSREARPGLWYWALKGEQFDGHDFVEAAIKNGASGVVVKEGFPRTNNLRVPYIEVGDTWRALGVLANSWRTALGGLKLVALTGSVGKTTVKEMLNQVLSAKGKTVATRGNYNNEIGVPLTLFRVTEHDHFAVIEMGARKVGDIKTLVNIAEPDVAVCLNAGSAHIGEFGSVENILKTKTEIFTHSRTQRLVAPKGDIGISHRALATGKKSVMFGENCQADVSVKNIVHREDGSFVLSLWIQGVLVEIDAPIFHQSYPINMAATAAAAKALGLKAEEIGKSLSGFPGVKGRYYIEKVDGRTLIDDSYNASPESMVAGFRSLAQAFSGKSLSLVLGTMLELGEESNDLHLGVGRAIPTLLTDVNVFTVGEGGEKIGEGAADAGLPKGSIRHFAKVDDLLSDSGSLGEFNDNVYVKGSNGVELSKLVDYLKG